MELDLQKAIINNKQYYVVPEDIFSHLKLSEKEKAVSVNSVAFYKKYTFGTN